MLALIFAGGEGSRLRLGEKALVVVHERPMIAWVLDAFCDADCEPVVATSYKTPFTRNWCRTNGVDYLDTSGSGYVEDLIEAVEVCGAEGALFTSAVDIPCLTRDIILRIRENYTDSGLPACSTWVPVSRCEAFGIQPRYREMICGVLAAPCAVNILIGGLICSAQEEYCLLLDEPGLVFNVNTREELATLEREFVALRKRVR
ncbi:MAG: NTP transferase domain-containing protein [Methanocalculaceae archaeon]|jgi:adenosylcobinamide-phosphate guanylyltransferase|nr:NTP transferase domain-containing protein [Methanocalculaceae archaeon]